MRTILRKIGNSRGILIPAAPLAECGIQDEIELRREGTRLVIEPAPTTRAGWFDGYRADADPDAWAELPADADHGEWQYTSTRCLIWIH